ncbi:hypothetical protein [Candidatus Regiella endosymbiont of Tuberolachnus salignus]
MELESRLVSVLLIRGFVQITQAITLENILANNDIIDNDYII